VTSEGDRTRGVGRRFCHNCGTELAHEATNFCPSCGVAQAPSIDVPTGPPPPIPQTGRISTPHVPHAPAPPESGGSRGGMGLRIATAIIALILMIPVGLQSCTAAVGGSMSENQGLSGAGAVGILVAFLFLIGGAFAIGIPMVSVVVFAIAGFFALIAGFSSEFKDLGIWGFVALILAVLSYFGHRLGRRRTIR
jgi:hypothetical protein